MGFEKIFKSNPGNSAILRISGHFRAKSQIPARS
jgi:hypothetical protein